MSYHVSMSDLITSTETASLLGVNPRTLLRWEERGWLKSKRDKNGNRIYRADHVRLAKGAWDQWLSLRRHHREHLRKLPAIQKEIERFIVTTPLSITDNGKLLNSKDMNDMKEAFQKMKDWQEKSQEINKMYHEFLGGDLVEHVKLIAKGLEAGRIK